MNLNNIDYFKCFFDTGPFIKNLRLNSFIILNPTLKHSLIYFFDFFEIKYKHNLTVWSIQKHRKNVEFPEFFSVLGF